MVEKVYSIGVNSPISAMYIYHAYSGVDRGGGGLADATLTRDVGKISLDPLTKVLDLHLVLLERPEIDTNLQIAFLLCVPLLSTAFVQPFVD